MRFLVHELQFDFLLRFCFFFRFLASIFSQFFRNGFHSHSLSIKGLVVCFVDEKYLKCSSGLLLQYFPNSPPPLMFVATIWHVHVQFLSAFGLCDKFSTYPTQKMTSAFTLNFKKALSNWRSICSSRLCQKLKCSNFEDQKFWTFHLEHLLLTDLYSLIAFS